MFAIGSKHFTCNSTLHNSPMRVGTIFIFFLQMRKLRFREVKSCFLRSYSHKAEVSEFELRLSNSRPPVPYQCIADNPYFLWKLLRHRIDWNRRISNLPQGYVVVLLKKF